MNVWSLTAVKQKKKKLLSPCGDDYESMEVIKCLFASRQSEFETKHNNIKKSLSATVSTATCKHMSRWRTLTRCALERLV